MVSRRCTQMKQAGPAPRVKEAHNLKHAGHPPPEATFTRNGTYDLRRQDS